MISNNGKEQIPKVNRDTKDPMGGIDDCRMRIKMIGTDSKNDNGRSWDRAISCNGKRCTPGW